jgi:mannose-6-phosphate isomerase-like protein (cupin superfamily)
MSEEYIIQDSPFLVPTDDGKLIEEFFGLASRNAGELSFAHMKAPPGWSEPFQTPGFDEITYIISGRKQIEISGKVIILERNKAIYIRKGNRVKYSNPFDEPVEYISVCIPAFSLDKVNRENS